MQGHSSMESTFGSISSVAAAIRFSRRQSERQRYRPKMADLENLFSAIIGGSMQIILTPSKCGFSSHNFWTWLRGRSVHGEPFIRTRISRKEPASQSSTPSWIKVPGIDHLHPNESMGMLCLVRQLFLYLHDTRRIIRGACISSFTGTRRYGTSIRATYHNWLSRWWRQHISWVTRSLLRRSLHTAHELRGLVSLWVYNCHVAVENVLSAAFWQSSGVFPRNYPRDLAPIAAAMATLAPVTAAQHICER